MKASNQHDAILCIPIYNEAHRLVKLLQKLKNADLEQTAQCDILFVDDGSNDGTVELLKETNYKIILHDQNKGIGAALRTGILWSKKQNYTFFAIIAGNGKMDPAQVNEFLKSLRAEEADYIQGSRYLPGGGTKNLPLFRHFMIKIFSSIVLIFTGWKGTDITCGFRAYRLSWLDHPSIDIQQQWLERYELEFYLQYKAIFTDTKMKEIPITMNYPEEKKNYSKIIPFIDWWSMIRPWIFLLLHIKK